MLTGPRPLSTVLSTSEPAAAADVVDESRDRHLTELGEVWVLDDESFRVLDRDTESGLDPVAWSG